MQNTDIIPRKTRRIVLKKYCIGSRLSEDNFRIEDTELPEISAGQVLVKVIYLSVDPYLRQLMTGRTLPSAPQFALGSPIKSLGVGRVVATRHESFKEGDIVEGSLAWQDICVVTAGTSQAHRMDLRLLDRNADQPHQALNELGLAGMNAYFGVINVAKPRRGETMLVSAAAGAIGSLAGQIGKILGARVVGLTSESKCTTLIEEFGFDAALDYRSAALSDNIRALLPNGPDIYFDNVGGAVSQTVMWTMTNPGRIVECGQISTYDDEAGGWNVNIWPIHVQRLRLESSVASYHEEFYPSAIAQMAHWVRNGRIHARTAFAHGLETAPGALVGLYQGQNIGKTLIAV